MPINGSLRGPAFGKLSSLATVRRTDCRMGLARPLDHVQTQSQMDVGPDSFDTKPSPLREGHVTFGGDDTAETAPPVPDLWEAR